jgi:hypothetical protein
MASVGAPASIAPEISYQLLRHRRIRLEHDDIGMTDPVEEDGVIANVGADIQDARTCCRQEATNKAQLGDLVKILLPCDLALDRVKRRVDSNFESLTE